MIPPGYPEIPVRAKVGLAPWFVAAVIVFGLLSDHGVISLQDAPHTRKPRTHSRTQRAAPPPAAPSSMARRAIPPAYLALYRRSGSACPHMSWGLLAGIGKVESGHGANMGPSSAGALGPMQFMPGTWAVWGRGGDVWDPRDAIPAAASKLCADGVAAGRVVQALHLYNCGRPFCRVSVAYANNVLYFARVYMRR